MDDFEYLKLLGDKIYTLRKEKGLSQQELAEKLGTQHTQIGRIERGLVNSGINTLRHIARELGVPISDLVKIDEDA